MEDEQLMKDYHEMREIIERVKLDNGARRKLIHSPIKSSTEFRIADLEMITSALVQENHRIADLLKHLLNLEDRITNLEPEIEFP